MSYELFCRFVQGAGHIKKGMPCEDYGMKFENDECKVFVLGDGHGDPNCPRSSFGSKAVCEIAVEVMAEFAKNIRESGLEKNLLKKNDSDPYISKEYTSESLIRQLIVSIVGRWSCRVNDDLEENPLTEKELDESKEYAEAYQKGEHLEHIYGTTMIAGLLTENYLLLLQQGDGRCVVFDSKGNASQPIPWDDRCIANITTSMCEEDAVVSCRYHIVDLKKNPVIACIAGSDGVEDSFSNMEKMHAYYREKIQLACEEGIAGLEEELALTLPFFSERGSQDDVTICGIIDREHCSGKLEKFAIDDELMSVSAAIREAEKRIPSMLLKLDFLRDRCDSMDGKLGVLLQEKQTVSLTIRKHEKTLQNLKSESLLIFNKIKIPGVQNRIAELEKQKNEIDEKIAVLQKKKDLCDEEYASYKEKYEAVLKSKEENEEKYRNLQLYISGSSADHQENTISEEPTEVMEAVPEAEEKVTEAAEEVTEVTEEAAEIAEEVTESTDEAAEIAEEVAESTDEAAEIAEEVAESTDEAVEIAEEVAESTDEAAEVTDEVTESTEEAAEIAEEVTEPTEEVTEITDLKLRIEMQKLEVVTDSFEITHETLRLQIGGTDSE